MHQRHKQTSVLLNKLLFPKPHPKPKLLAEYYTWFTSSASFGLFTVVIAALLAQNSETSAKIISRLELQAKATTSISAQLAKMEPPKIPKAVLAIATITPTPKPVSAPRPARETVSLELASGENIINMLTDQGISHDQAFNAVEAMSKVYNPRNLQAGQEISLNLHYKHDDSLLEKMSLRVNPLETVTIEKSAGRFLAEKAEIETQRKSMHAGGPIRGSLYQTAARSGMNPQMIQEVISALSYDVDFQRDIQPGQQFDVLFDHYVDDAGRSVKKGELKFVSLALNGKTLELYRYRDAYGNSGFYHANGESIRKSLLKTPVNGARISSGFGMRRHPVLGYSKMHRGMDFAAPVGTPVYAGGDGIVQRANYFGTFGNYLAIKHNGTYTTAYGHLQRFAPGVRPGARVKQGQIVAYIGTTGRSTGPHLHYEIMKYGTQINPNQAKLMAGNYLEGRQLAAFKAHVSQIKTQIAALPRNKQEVASAESHATHTRN
jgi:murein DD-endopeptidase MepM/ murein hydrolase activator NlpD